MIVKTARLLMGVGMLIVSLYIANQLIYTVFGTNVLELLAGPSYLYG